MDLWATVPYYTAYLSRALLNEPIDLTVGSISYPFDLGCGLTQPGRAAVKAWIYDTAGDHSRPVTVTLACAT